MKTYILFLLFPIIVGCQPKKIGQKNTLIDAIRYSPSDDEIKALHQRDTTFYQVTRDTTFGVIAYKVGSGQVKGDGILVKFASWVIYSRLPATPPIHAIRGNDTIATYYSGSSGTQNAHYTTVFLKTNKGYLELDNPYTFIPN